MPKSATNATTPVESSLHLRTILEEEYTYIHEPYSNKGVVVFELIKPDELVDKLTKTKQDTQPENTLVGGNESTPIPQDNQLVGPVPKRPYCSETPYTRLAEWTKSAAGQAVTSESIREVLRKKVDDPSLLTDEPWLLDAAIRPYTRGLLKRYQKQTKTDRSSVDTAELRQLLLEDAFAEHIQPKDNSTLDPIFSKMLDRYQSALCLSGGGIRSATFALGIIQGLAKHDLLDQFAYLSTVSGGGYVGGWLSAWSHHEGFDQVVAKLKTTSNTPIATEADPIHHLRQYSNYLSPQLGLFSADTWTLVATYMRNLLLIWLVLLPFLAALAAAPLVIVSLANYELDYSRRISFWVIGLLLFITAILTSMAIRYVHAYIPTPTNLDASEKKLTEQPRQSERDQAAFINNCLLPFSVAVLLIILVWQWFQRLDPNLPHWAAAIHNSLGLNHSTGLNIWSMGGLAIMAGTMCTHVAGWLLARPTRKKPLLQALMFITIAVIGGFAGFLMLLTAKLLRSASIDMYICLGFPCFILAILLTGYVFEGIISRFIADSRREWTARYSAWLLIVGIGWLTLTSIILLGPGLISTIKLQIASLGFGSGVLTALLGGSAKTAGNGHGAGSRQGKGNATGLIGIISGFALPLAATLTLVILLILLSLFDRAMIDLINAHIPDWLHAQNDLFMAFTPLLVLALLTGIGWGIALVIDTNRFSLHAMYRTRLIRAYLGASRSQAVRRPDPFTGFDEDDNMPIGTLDQLPGQPLSKRPEKAAKRAPFHIINLALNLVSGEKLAWQERKAEAFSVSQLHAGAMNLGYRRTSPLNGHKPNSPDSSVEQQACNYYGGNEGISLGTAMTISGAAASPNMGYHSSPLIAFLMTLFNVRLGWWLGNPGPAGDTTFYQSKPALAVKPILDELLGKTNDTNEYVYLSDGGHFENLGLYEMVLRRNRFIVVSDASCDEKCTLEDLGNAIRKIRIDLGIPIEFTSDFNIHARAHKLPVGDGQYWALGRIFYSAVDSQKGKKQTDPNETDGILLYIKPGIYGEEPRDVFNYSATQSAFPHESTADQFFSESQFESYRALGRYAMETIVNSFPEKAGIPLADLFKADGPKKHWEFMKTKKG